jgi:hypothetical protein
VVTTFHRAGYEKYGSRMIETFLKNWPQAVELHVYAEDCDIQQHASNLVVHDLHQRVPALVKFKQQYQADLRATGRLAQGPPDRKGKQPGIGFRWDAVRFSHKVYAQCDLARRRSTGTMIWMDADMVCHSAIGLDILDQEIPQDVGVAFLGRARKYTETGLWAINLDRPGSHEFMERMQWAYDHAEQGVLAMKEYHDCWVFDRTREWMTQHFPAWQQLDWNRGSLQGEGHPLINTAWGAYLDHLKGRRKDQGCSTVKDLVSPRTERYWQSS